MAVRYRIATSRVLASLRRLLRRKTRPRHGKPQLLKGKEACTHHFIHIPKNGGNSMRKAVARLGYVSLTNPMHYRYIDIADLAGRDLTYFCVVRNPWSRTVSRFEFARKISGNWPADDPRTRYLATATFEDFVRKQRIFHIPEHPGQPWMGPLSSWMNQLEWVKDEAGVVRCDCLRLEEIDADFSDYFKIPASLPNRNRTPGSADYRTYYTDELNEIIANTFRDDIEYFGFSFDSSATRNIATLD